MAFFGEKLGGINVRRMDSGADASVLGDTVHPRNFSTLRRISKEDGFVIEEEEQLIKLASSESLMQQL